MEFDFNVQPEIVTEPRQHREEFKRPPGLAIVALILPVVAGSLLFFVSSTAQALILSYATVVVTTILLAIDAGRFRIQSPGERKHETPTFVFLAGMLLFWGIGYPVVYYLRGKIVRPRLMVPSIVVVLYFSLGPFLYAFLMPPTLPACTSDVVVNTLLQAVKNSPNGKLVKSIDQFEELSFDPKLQIRHGRCVQHLENADTELKYEVTWQDRGKNLFYVKVMPSGLPRCDDPAVTNLLASILPNKSGTEDQRVIDQHREIRFDAENSIRHCRCVVRTADDDANVEYTIEWQDIANGVFNVKIISHVSLPSCASEEVVKMLEKALRDSPIGAAAGLIDGHRDLHFDQEEGIRYGSCVMHGDKGEVEIHYQVSWQDRDTNFYRLFVAPAKLPECTNPEVIKLLETLIRDGYPDQTITAIEGHLEQRFDPDAQVRYGECVWKTEDGSFDQLYSVEWQDQSKGMIYVRLLAP